MEQICFSLRQEPDSTGFVDVHASFHHVSVRRTADSWLNPTMPQVKLLRTMILCSA